MAATLDTTQEAARLWSDPATRARIVGMHARGDSLLEMVSALGLDDTLDSDGLRGVIEGLSAAEVQVIRDAFVSEAASNTADGAHFPIDCRVDDVGQGVAISAVAGAAGPVARIEPAATTQT